MIKTIFGKILSVTLAFIIAAFCFAPAANAAVAYPQGVTKEQSKEIMLKLDVLLITLLKETEQGSLENIVVPSVCNDSTMSSLTKEIYLMMAENAETLSTIGMNISPSNAATYLGSYPDVQSRLASASDWNSVNLDGAVWGITDETSFTNAAVAVLSPFNELLYTILCAGSYSLNPLIGITGAKGYENVVTGIYANFGLKTYTAPETFYADAATDKTTMVRHIVTDILSFVKFICGAPATRLSTVLPGIAYFIQNGGLDSAITTLVDPIKINILGITTPFQVGNIMESVGESQSGMSLDLNLGDIMTIENFQTAPFDMATLASCGAHDGTAFTADLGDAFIYLLRWIIETLKLNRSTLPSVLSQFAAGLATQQTSDALITLLDKSTDELISLIVKLFTAKSGEKNPHLWSFAAQQQTQVSYTPNLDKGKYQRVLDGIDELLSQFVKEGGTAKNIRGALAPEIYSNELVTKLVKGFYGEFEKEEMQSTLNLLGLYLSPTAVSQLLSEDEFYDISYTLSECESFSSLPDDLNWGFTDGDKDGFINAVCAVFRPLDGVLRMLLCEGEFSFKGVISFYGSDGYNTGVIPILEALGCTFTEIRTYDEFVAQTKEGDILRPIVLAVVSLLERVLDAPVKTITEILPNLMYFLNNGGIKLCVENLFYPITKLLGEVGVSSLIDLTKITNLDYRTLLSELTSSLTAEIKLPEINLEQFAGMGSLMTVQTKRTQAGQPLNISYILADQTAVLVTFLRYLVEVIKTPGNESLLTSFMNSGGEGGNDMFATYSAGIGDEIAKMSVDETVEWLYKLFFRERAVDAQLAAQDYMPTIIYEGNMGFKLSGKTISLIVLLLAILTMFAIINRERLIPFLASLSKRKISKKNTQEV